MRQLTPLHFRLQLRRPLTPTMPTVQNACDACRLRKVKCTRRGDSDSACNFCSSIGISCHTRARQRQRSKKATGTSKSKAAAPRPQAITPIPCASSSRLPSALSRQLSTNIRSQHGPRLLGVPGLTRTALDTCIETFFSTVGQVFRLSQAPSVFTRRMRVRLYYDSGLDLPAELADVASEPASRLLILAVACRGAFFSPYAALADDLYTHCAHTLSESDDVVTDYLDAIEAIILLSELTIQPRHATALELNPLGKGTVVDLALYHRLHVAPPPGAPDFERRLALFSRVWAHDAIRSASAHISYRIADDDFGWPMDPDAEDIPFVALTLATREICATLLSPKARGLGASDESVQRILKTLSSLRARMKVNIDALTACLAPGAAPENEPLYPMNAGDPLKPMEQLFLLSTHDWLHLVVWVAVQELSERPSATLSASTIAAAESATFAACEDIAILAEISTTHGLHVRGPRSIRNHMAAFALFLVRVFSSIENPTIEQSSRFFALSEALNFGVRSATYYPDSETLANTLRMALYQATRVAGRDAARVAERGLEGLPNDNDLVAPDSIAGLQSAAQVPSDSAPAAPTPQISRPLQQFHPIATGPDSLSMFPGREQYFNRSDSADASGFPALDGAAATLPPSACLSVPLGSENMLIDWDELMDTLKSCGFELPLGPL